jgi:hypothetical protein
MARYGHGSLSDLGPLSEVERKSDFGSATSVVDPERTLEQSERRRGFKSRGPVVTDCCDPLRHIGRGEVDELEC